MTEAVVYHIDASHLTKNRLAETVERKGIGHPDSICDGIAEACSRALSKQYRDIYGKIMHHNVDKALLLCANLPSCNFGAKCELESPIRYIQSGRAAPLLLNGKSSNKIFTEGILTGAIYSYIDENINGLYKDNCLINENNFKVEFKIGEGSRALVENLLKTSDDKVLPAGDTSFGCGFWPRTPTEELVYETEKKINSIEFKKKFPASGTDVKVMGNRVRKNGKDEINLTVAIAMIASKIENEDHYSFIIKEMTDDLREFGKDLLYKSGIEYNLDNIGINRAGVYLTHLGLSCDNADEGQVGRGNRVSGLITPMRPGSLEAAAGKNPANHSGKLYNLAATVLATEIAEKFSVDEVNVILTSNIGHPLTEPGCFNVNLIGDVTTETVRSVQDYAQERLNKELFFEITEKVVNGELAVF